MATCRVVILSLFLLFLSVSRVEAQETDRPDALPVPADTTVSDTLAVPPRADTLRVAPPGDVGEAPSPPTGPQLDEPVEFTAADSLVIEFRKDGDVGTLFGQSRVTYGEAELQAYRIDILFETDELRAQGLPSDTGMVGRPQFGQGQEAFTGTELAFNLQTERGRVVGARTNIQEGFIQAGVVKVDQDSTIYIAEGAYTTCECVEDPSYTLRSDKMKIVDKEWIYTGPIQLFLFNIPTPLWLPFGFLPAREGRRSGPLPPRYGEDDRGFYLSNWGWYQAINDYMDAQVQFGLWTLGSWQVNPQFRYARRYRYRGQVGVDYVRNRSGERGDPDYSEFGTARIRWNHNQELSPTSRFNADVDLSSSSYLRTTSEQYNDRVRQTIGSSIGYSKNWRRQRRSLSLDVSHRQNLANRQVDATLPSLRFSQGSRKPFAREQVVGDERWYERITYDYSGSLNNRYSFNPIAEDSAAADIAWYEAMFSPSKYRRATGDDEPFDFKASHRVSSSASFTVNRIPVIDKLVRFYVSPNLNYTEDWFIQTEHRRLDEDSTAVRESVPDFLALRQFSTGISANTTFYGIFPVRVGPFNGLRHTVRPSLSFNYRPDFYDDFWGYTDTYRDRNGDLVRYPLVEGVQRSRQQSMSFSVSNVFETKRVATDTTGESQSRPLQLLNLDLSSSYNFAADSMKLSDISMRARTRIADQLSLNVSSTFSPYALNDAGSREINRFLFQNNPLKFARLSRLSVSVNTSFQSEQQGPGRPFATPSARATASPAEFAGDAPFQTGDPFRSPYYNTSVGYADFAIPWSLNLDLSYNYRYVLGSGTRPARPDHTATLNTSFDFNLTPNWKVQGRSGYDFKQGDIVYTSFAILRDFDCWEMAINWIPFGDYQSYSFDLHVKSGHLRDILRLRQPRSDVKGRFRNILD